MSDSNFKAQVDKLQASAGFPFFQIKSLSIQSEKVSLRPEAWLRAHQLSYNFWFRSAATDVSISLNSLSSMRTGVEQKRVFKGVV